MANRFAIKHARTSKLASRARPAELLAALNAKRSDKYVEALIPVVTRFLDNPTLILAPTDFANELVTYIATKAAPTAMPSNLVEAMAAARIFRLPLPGYATSDLRRADWTNSYTLNADLVAQAADTVARVRMQRALSASTLSRAPMTTSRAMIPRISAQLSKPAESLQVPAQRQAPLPPSRVSESFSSLTPFQPLSLKPPGISDPRLVLSP